jgi:hypothetical protein
VLRIRDILEPDPDPPPDPVFRQWPSRRQLLKNFKFFCLLPVSVLFEATFTPFFKDVIKSHKEVTK